MNTLEKSEATAFTTWQWTDQETFSLGEALRGIGFPDPDPGRLTAGIPAVWMQRCAPGEVLMQEGDSPREVFIFHSGKVDVIKRLADGRGIRVAQLGPGAVVGEMALASGEPRAATVVTTEPTDVFALSDREFRFLLDLSPAFRYRMERLVGERRQTMARL